MLITFFALWENITPFTASAGGFMYIQFLSKKHHHGDVMWTYEIVIFVLSLIFKQTNTTDLALREFLRILELE